jgi:hypothetical protein
MVNEVHINPTDNGTKRFFTQGTVFLRINSFSEIISSDWILKTDRDAKYYPNVINARNKDLIFMIYE